MKEQLSKIAMSLRPVITDDALNEKRTEMWQDRREKSLAAAKDGIQANRLREYREYKAKAMK